MDFSSRYYTPGVYTEDEGGPQLQVQTSVPTAVAIFGLSVGYRTHRQSLRINPDTRDAVTNDEVPAINEPLKRSGAKVITTLPKVVVVSNVDVAAPTTSTFTGVNPAVTDPDDEDFGSPTAQVTLQNDDLLYLDGQTNSTQNGLYRFNVTTTTGSSPTTTRSLTRVVDTFRVVNPSTGEPYVNGRDYTIHRLGVGDDLSPGTRDDTYTVRRVISPASLLEEGDVPTVVYNYTDVGYHQPKVLYDYDDIRDIYGSPFSSDGTIRSELTLAAKIAILNGATTVITCAVDPDERNEDGTTKAISDCYQSALNRLRNEGQIAVVVCASGDQDYHDMIKSHVTFQSGERYERRAVIGIDGSGDGNLVETSERITAAQTLASKRVALVSPTRFWHFAPELNKRIVLGGQFVAAAVAGRSVSLPPAMPLTRKAINGFVGPDEFMDEGQKDLESQNGLLVVEKTRRNQVQVRHGVTTDPTDLLSREWSITGQQDVMIYRVRDYLEADGLIGMPVYDTTLIQVKASAEAALSSLERDGVIVSYRNLKVRQLATMPDVVEVRYEWQPAYPLNYILVRYSVAVMSGDVTVSEDV